MAASARPLRPPYPSEPMKRCTKCREEKPPTDFRRDRSRKDGRYPQCKACERRWRQENAEYMADYHRRWQEGNVERSGRRIAGIGSASAQTPTTGSEGEPGIASTARGSEPGYPIRRPRQTTAEPGPSPRCNGARKARLLRSDPRTDPLLEQRSRSGRLLAGPLASDEAHEPRCGVLLLDDRQPRRPLGRRGGRLRHGGCVSAQEGLPKLTPWASRSMPRSVGEFRWPQTCVASDQFGESRLSVL